MMLNRSATWHQSLTIDLIASPIRIYTPEIELASAVREMEDKNWDLAGFSKNGSNSAEAIIKMSELKKCGATWESSTEVVDIGLLVAHQTPIRDAMERIVRHGNLYVFGKLGIDQMVTLADLNKQQVKLLLFGILSSFEVGMQEWIRKMQMSDADLVDVLGNRLEGAQKIFMERRKKQEDTDLLDCLMFIDKVKLVKSHDSCLFVNEFESNKKMKSAFNRMQEIRDALAHARDPSEDITWSDIIETIDLTEKLTDLLYGE